MNKGKKQLFTCNCEESKKISSETVPSVTFEGNGNNRELGLRL